MDLKVGNKDQMRLNVPCHACSLHWLACGRLRDKQKRVWQSSKLTVTISPFATSLSFPKNELPASEAARHRESPE